MSHFSKEYLEQLRNSALSAAGFSAGIIILLAQTKGQPSYSPVSLWAAIISLITWLYAWQYVAPFIIHGERTYKHFNFVLAGVLPFIGITALFTSVVATVWHLSPCAAVVLSVLGVALAIAVLVHFHRVDKYCNEGDV